MQPRTTRWWFRQQADRGVIEPSINVRHATTRYLGTQRCSECGVFCRRVGAGGLCPECGEPVAVADLLDVGDSA